jgi:hypothetical protein
MLTSSGNAVVATPGSGGVVLLRTPDLTALTTFRTGGEPLEAALLPDGYVAARNWKAGDLLIGTVMSRPTRVSRDASSVAVVKSASIRATRWVLTCDNARSGRQSRDHLA